MPSTAKTLILVKHSLPEIRPEAPACEWTLSPEGRRRCTLLAEKLTPYQPERLFSSQEPKAVETAQLAGARLNLLVQAVPGLHEHERRTVGWSSKTQFQESVRHFFEEPDTLVFGEETARQAQERFWKAAHTLIADHPGENLVLVAHGTVISLFVTKACGLAPYSTWQRLGLPSFLVLSLPELAILHTCVRV